MSSVSGMRPGVGMWRIIVALVRQRRRLWLATIAVALSVGYLAGALTLLNRVSDGLADLAAAGAENADLVVEGEVAYESALEQTRRLIPSSIGQSLMGQPGIAAVAPRVEDVTMLLDSKGDPLVAPGLSEQPMGSNWPNDKSMSPYRFVGAGSPPKAQDEVVIDRRSAEAAGVSVGDLITVAARTSLGSYKVVGIVTTDKGDLPQGSSLALFTTDQARQLFDMPTNDNRVAIRLDKGADVQEVSDRISSSLPAGSELVDGATGAMHRQESLTRSFTLIRALIMGFAALALVVGMVTVANSLTLLYSERRHSFATFRLLGAKESQVLLAALTEAAVLAAVASLIGVPLGLILGRLIEAVLGALGTSIPVGGSAVSIPALLTAVVVGSVATILAAVVPARRACRVAAIEAIVETEAARDKPFTARLTRSATIAAATGIVLWGFLTIADLASGSAGLIALGVALGVVVVSLLPLGLAHAVAAGIRIVPERSGTLRRIGARDALRNRGRTAATTGALLMATAVVGGLAVFLASFASSIDADVSDLVTADLVVDSGTFTRGGLSGDILEKLSDIDQVDAVSGWEVGRAYVGDIPVRLTGIDGAALKAVLSPQWVGAAPDSLSISGIALSQAAAEKIGASVGSPIPVRFQSESIEMLDVEGIYATGGLLLGDAMINRSVLKRQVPLSIDLAGLVSLNPDTPAARAAVKDVAKSFGIKSVLKPSDFVNRRSDLLRGFERVIQWMLLFTLVQALVGVVNTLLLSVGERRREFGLLRAAGASRTQILRLVLVEGASFAVVGTLLGLIVGVVGARIAMAALGRFGITGFVVPIWILLVTGLAASSLGVLAAVVPARWAAAVPPLEAVVDSGGAGSRSRLNVRVLVSWIRSTWAGPTPDLATTISRPYAEPSPEQVAPQVPSFVGGNNFAGEEEQNVGAVIVEDLPVQQPANEPLTEEVTAAVAAAMLASSVVDATATERHAASRQEAGEHAAPREEAGQHAPSRTDGDDRVSDERWIKPAAAQGGGQSRPKEPRPTQGPEEPSKTLFAPGGGVGRPRPAVRAPRASQPVPAALRRALGRLRASSVEDARPTLLPLSRALAEDEVVLHMIQGWAKGLPCVIARTDRRIILVVSRFPEPLIESLHPTRTTISLYGPPSVQRVSVAIVDGRRMLDVTGVLDRDEAAALKGETTSAGGASKGYF